MSGMRIHFLGICGTFMGGIALLARELGHQVSGMDEHIYPPMSDILAKQKIDIINGYAIEDLPDADIYVIGNIMRRGMPLIEHLLNSKLKYISAPQWLAENVLAQRKVIAIAGTHGKTTITSLVAKIFATKDAGYLIAGGALDFSKPAYLGSGKEFILEADEYDSAFFDKRSKFIHYRPDILLINNLEYDHADIFADLSAIESQFCHLLRTIPSTGHVICPFNNSSVERCFSQETHSNAHNLLGLANGIKTIQKKYTKELNKIKSSWYISNQGQEVRIYSKGGYKCNISCKWKHKGAHNRLNLLSAVAVATIGGISSKNIINAVQGFQGVARRLQSLGKIKGAELISDFAHHPTAIYASIKAVKQKNKQTIAVVELASNTIRMGVHKKKLMAAVADADIIFWFAVKKLYWNEELKQKYEEIHYDTDYLAQELYNLAGPNKVILLMSNSSFGGLINKLRSFMDK